MKKNPDVLIHNRVEQIDQVSEWRTIREGEGKVLCLLKRDEFHGDEDKLER